MASCRQASPKIPLRTVLVVLATALPCLDFSREVTIYEAYGDLTNANLAQGWDDLLVESVAVETLGRWAAWGVSDLVPIEVGGYGQPSVRRDGVAGVIVCAIAQGRDESPLGRRLGPAALGNGSSHSVVITEACLSAKAGAVRVAPDLAVGARRKLRPTHRPAHLVVTGSLQAQEMTLSNGQRRT
jgi:hypothetical protein